MSKEKKTTKIAPYTITVAQTDAAGNPMREDGRLMAWLTADELQALQKLRTSTIDAIDLQNVLREVEFNEPDGLREDWARIVYLMLILMESENHDCVTKQDARAMVNLRNLLLALKRPDDEDDFEAA